MRRREADSAAGVAGGPHGVGVHLQRLAWALDGQVPARFVEVARRPRSAGGRGPGLSLPWAVSRRPKATWAWSAATLPSPTVLSHPLKPERLVCPLPLHTHWPSPELHTLHVDAIAHLATATGRGLRHLSRHTPHICGHRQGSGGPLRPPAHLTPGGELSVAAAAGQHCAL